MNTQSETVDKLEEQENQVPIACLLTPEEQATRKDDVGDLLAMAQQVRELADGYEFSYPVTGEWVARLTECILFERECCPFFTFEMVFEADLGPMWLRLRGPGDVKEFVRATLLPDASE